MTRKHFKLIAETIRETLEISACDRDSLFSCALNLADNLKRENPRFNKDKFLQACGF